MFLNNPNYVKVGEKKYRINTDFRVALKCEEVVQDETISDVERTLAIIFLLFGKDGLDDTQNYEKLIELATKYLMCNQEQDDEEIKPNMSYKQDLWLIEASFKTDYGIDLHNGEMHFWDFNKYLNGLKEDCILNRVRELRDYDVNSITDMKEKEKIQKAQRKWALKKKEKHFTEEQIKAMNDFHSQLKGSDKNG